ncbi:mechanosensitive ion channel family protein [Parendozoicomonas haliclonae]|uniref:Low conductance mechanosensitive channel YnaI n=2 Tax=Parendozoicomonas haliclonae TaxID=1960125 RepID=A0A1X7AKD7_9GAMM|nr:Low conductance mechanosensitive channel YnaI [Parendozoicomonas haliclonae]
MEYLTEFKSWISTYESWIIQVVVAGVITTVIHFGARVLLARLDKKLENSQKLWDESLVYAIRLPLQVIIWLAGLMWMANIADLETKAAIFQGVSRLHELMVMGVLSWTIIRFVNRLEKRFLAIGPRVMQSKVDPTTAMAISKLVRVIIFFVTGLVILQAAGYSLSGVLAFGGVGGVAVGFASKDLLANFFGGMMISMDRPFKVGDWISSPDKQIEGTVEYIGWRLTRIRTFDKRPLYVPNSMFTSISVENPSRMLNRRIKQVIGLRYCDAGVMGEVLADIRSYLASQPEIDDNQLSMVNFISFGESTLNFQIYCFTRTCDWSKYLMVQEDILLHIVEIIHSHGADIAFPTRTLDLPEGLFGQTEQEPVQRQDSPPAQPEDSNAEIPAGQGG